MTMRIHTNTLNFGDLQDAAAIARVALDRWTSHGSRTHGRAFEVTLTGESKRRPQGWSGHMADYAATWDQWGVFLSVLFDRDPEMVCGTVKHPAYADRYDFDRKTNGRFAPFGTDGAGDRYGKGDNGRDEARYWPQDAHGDHKFEFEGVLVTGSIIHRCTKCSAAQIRFP